MRRNDDVIENAVRRIDCLIRGQFTERAVKELRASEVSEFLRNLTIMLDSVSECTGEIKDALHDDCRYE